MSGDWYLAERGSAAWVEAWAALIREFGDPECRHEPSGECWQYMGTEQRGDRWTHCFRHRALYGGPYAYRHYPATPPLEGEP
jgi:hypothetical protein